MNNTLNLSSIWLTSLQGNVKWHLQFPVLTIYLQLKEMQMQINNFFYFHQNQLFMNYGTCFVKMLQQILRLKCIIKRNCVIDTRQIVSIEKPKKGTILYTKVVQFNSIPILFKT